MHFSGHVAVIFAALKLSPTTGAHLLATNSNHHYVKCIDIYPKSESDLLLAIGQANGRVTLSTFGPSIYDTQGLTGKDLGKHKSISQLFEICCSESLFNNGNNAET